jgi:3-oxoadipate enol-lactonase
VTALPAHDVAGEGANVVLFVHGIGGGRAIWGGDGSGSVETTARALGCRAAALDLPGYGDSQALGPPTMQGMADAVVVCLEALAPRRAAIVGHSMGGMVAQELQALRPGLVQALVLACTSPAFGRSEGDWQARFVAERLAPLDAGDGMAGMATRLVPQMVAPLASADARERAINVMSRVPEETYRAALRAIVAFDRRAALTAINVPVLCLAAEHDRTAPPAVMERMAARIPGAEYECLADGGHIANVEQPAAFDAAVISFLERHGF